MTRIHMPCKELVNSFSVRGVRCAIFARCWATDTLSIRPASDLEILVLASPHLRAEDGAIKECEMSQPLLDG